MQGGTLKESQEYAAASLEQQDGAVPLESPDALTPSSVDIGDSRQYQ